MLPLVCIPFVERGTCGVKAEIVASRRGMNGVKNGYDGLIECGETSYIN